MKIDRVDHLVLTVYDLERTCEFYREAPYIPSLEGRGYKAGRRRDGADQ